MVLKSKLIGSCVQSDINLTQSDLRLDWNWVYQKRGWFFCQLVSCLPRQGRRIHGQDGPGTGSRGVTNREVEIWGIWTRVALRCSVVWHWQWRRQHQVGSGNGHGGTTRPSLAIPASWIFNNYLRVWTKRGFLYYLTYILFNVVIC